jgi:DNA-damage-inducible protein D
MKKEQIIELFEKFESARTNIEGVECWSARELRDLFGYTKWSNFMNVINKAKIACEKVGENPNYHFADVGKMINLAKGAMREVEDVALTRYACYLIAQNGNPSKSEVAFAQTYFAVQTRKQEIIEQRLLDVARVVAREKLSKSEKKLSGIIYERGVDDRGFATIRSKGDSALFGGHTTQDMKKRFGASDKKPLADFLPTLTIKAKDFAIELTSHKVVEKDLKREKPITDEHVDNNTAIRKMLIERGVRPEDLPPAEDVDKIRRRLAGDERRVLKDMKKIQEMKRK